MNAEGDVLMQNHEEKEARRKREMDGIVTDIPEEKNGLYACIGQSACQSLPGQCRFLRNNDFQSLPFSILAVLKMALFPDFSYALYIPSDDDIDSD